MYKWLAKESTLPLNISLSCNLDSCPLNASHLSINCLVYGPFRAPCDVEKRNCATQSGNPVMKNCTIWYFLFLSRSVFWYIKKIQMLMWFTNLLLKATGYIKNQMLMWFTDLLLKAIGFANVFVPVIISDHLLWHLQTRFDMLARGSKMQAR